MNIDFDITYFLTVFPIGIMLLALAAWYDNKFVATEVIE